MKTHPAYCKRCHKETKDDICAQLTDAQKECERLTLFLDVARNQENDALHRMDAAQAKLDNAERDAARYNRLRILGCAPCGTPQLDQRTVIRFQSLDDFLDADLKLHASRGEYRPDTLKVMIHCQVCKSLITYLLCSDCAQCVCQLSMGDNPECCLHGNKAVR